ncbi:hypothetical protein V8C37DRAFT_383632 [Trichoderma ceciliae]
MHAPLLQAHHRDSSAHFVLRTPYMYADSDSDMCVLVRVCNQVYYLHTGGPTALGPNSSWQPTKALGKRRRTSTRRRSFGPRSGFEVGNFCGKKPGLHSYDHSVLVLPPSSSRDELTERL